MFRAAIDLCNCCGVMVNTEEHRESLFCSEFVAALYMDVGVLHPEHHQPADEFVPSDFTRDHGCNLSSLCGCCWWSWCLGRNCGVGEIYRHEDGKLHEKLFQPEILLQTKAPPAALLKKPDDVPAATPDAATTAPADAANHVAPATKFDGHSRRG